MAVDGLTVVNESFGSITGQGGINAGIFAADTLTVFNDESANITGGADGIFAFADAEITNDGNITGATSGITLTDNAFVDNSGLITGATGIDLSFGAVGGEIINSGEIRSTNAGGDAISGSAGIDSVALDQGSLITGNILGGAGADTLLFNAGIMTPGGPSNAVRGDVTGFDTITKEGGGVAFIGTPDDVGTGLNVAAREININSGGLYINADIAATTINTSGAALGGTGLWTTDINVLAGGFSAGAIPINLDLIPENSVGVVEVVGNVVHSPGSFIRVDIVPNTVDR